MVQGFHARREFARLARFGANILDAHSCFIFLPKSAVAILDRQSVGNASYGALNSNSGNSNFGMMPGTSSQSPDDEIVLIGAHSLSQKCIPDCIIHVENGLVGWVARHGHPIHVSPFEHDSRTLGTYSEDQQLKSFIAVPLPIPLSIRGELAPGSQAGGQMLSGVLAADSKKAFAFSKLQGKLLEELAEQASSLIVVALSSIQAQRDTLSLETFFEKAEQFVSVLGGEAVEALRISPMNLSVLERDLGLARVDMMMKQLYRLFEQSLPPNTPVYVSPSGDLLCLVDNMMSSYFEGKAQALAEHVSVDLRTGGASKGRAVLSNSIAASPHSSTSAQFRSVQFKFQRSGLSKRRGETRSVGELVAATIEQPQDNEQVYKGSVTPFTRFLRKVV